MAYGFSYGLLLRIIHDVRPLRKLASKVGVVTVLVYIRCFFGASLVSSRICGKSILMSIYYLLASNDQFNESVLIRQSKCQY